MKRAVSISLGSAKRNKAVEVTLLGEPVSIERIGTVPVISSNRSASVDLPESMCAMMTKFRMWLLFFEASIPPQHTLNFL